MKPANIINGEAFPADWNITPGTPTIVIAPGATYELASFADAVLLRDLITTRSRSVDRDKRSVR